MTTEKDRDSSRRQLQQKKELINIVRGDLDWITMKALEKDRARRYETVNGFASDIQRHLQDEPVLARRPTKRYRLKKFMRKHRSGVRLVVAVSLLMCAGLTSYDWFAFRYRTASTLSALAEITASNCEAALAFENETDASAVLSALRIHDQFVSAGLYDRKGQLFARYPADQPAEAFPATYGNTGARFMQSHLVIFVPVVYGEQRFGMLYLKFKSGSQSAAQRFRRYSWIGTFAIAASLVVALLRSRRNTGISQLIRTD